ncbi:MAG: hypothetical protein HYZ57_09400 [Acidobacteria bacterium]|nr:hypothetical protein [Acidobacteriota bacterium]
MLRSTGLIVALSFVSLAADRKQAGPVQSGNELVEVSARAHVDKQDVVRLLGQTPDYPMVVVEVKAVPKDGKKLAVWRDDFTLLSNRDGQRSQPLAPSQIAGKGALVISSTGGGGTGVGSTGRGPIWGGGPVGVGRPRRIGDDEVMLNGSAGESQAALQAGEKEKENPLLTALEQKILPEKETAAPVEGLLYFIFEGKVKIKDLELIYKTPDGRLILDFER